MQDFIHKELKTSERVRWADQPNALKMAMPVFLIWLFAIPWTAFALFWEMIAIGISNAPNTPSNTPSGFSIIFVLFGLPFVLFGFAMLLFPFFAYRESKRTYYVITNKRLIIINSGKYFEVQSFDYRFMTRLTRKERKDGFGDVTFIEKNYIDSDGDKATKINGVYKVKEVRKVEKMLIELAREE